MKQKRYVAMVAIFVFFSFGVDHNRRHTKPHRKMISGSMGVLLYIVVLPLNTSLLVLLLRYSRMNPDSKDCLRSTNIIMSKIFRVFVCLLEWLNANRSMKRLIDVLYDQLVSKPNRILEMIIPCFFYAISNNLNVIAFSYLNAPSFVVLVKIQQVANALSLYICWSRRPNLLESIYYGLLIIGLA